MHVTKVMLKIEYILINGRTKLWFKRWRSNTTRWRRNDRRVHDQSQSDSWYHHVHANRQNIMWYASCRCKFLWIPCWTNEQCDHVHHASSRLVMWETWRWRTRFLRLNLDTSPMYGLGVRFSMDCVNRTRWASASRRDNECNEWCETWCCDLCHSGPVGVREVTWDGDKGLWVASKMNWFRMIYLTTPWFEDGAKVVRIERSAMERMKTAGVRPDVVTLNTLIRSYCMDRNMRAAMSLLGTIRTSGLRPDDRTYNTLMQGRIELKNMDRAMDLFKQMKRNKRARPTIVTYTLLIAGWAREMGRLIWQRKWCKIWWIIVIFLLTLKHSTHW